jgi:glyoxylase-like metal-dependent hydrolase (beta-lactamase superfamily II)
MTLYAVKYGESRFPASQIFKGDKSGRSLPFAWLFYVMKTDHGTILVDTGFHEAAAAKRFGVRFLPYQNELAAAGVTPESVTLIILTHAHFDHAGGIDLYPRANIVVNERERNSGALKNVNSSRIIMFKDDFSVSQGITVRRAGGHTPGSSYVEISYGPEKIILTGDEAYLPENVSKGIPVGAFCDSAANVNFLTMAKSSGARIFTFHDPSIVTKGCVRKIIP